MKTFYLKIVMAIYLCMILNPTWGQNTYADSLKLALEQTNSVEEKISTLFLLVEEFLYIDSKTCVEYTDQIIETARANNLAEDEARGYLWKGRAYIIDYNHDLSLENFQKAEELFEAERDSFYLAKVYNGLGILKKYNAEYEESINYQFKAVEMLERVGEPVDVGTTYNSIGTLYVSIGDMENGEKYLNIAIENLEKDPQAQIAPMLNLAGLLEDDKDQKLSLLRRCYAQAQSNDHHRYSAVAASMLAEYYEKIELNQDSMRAYYKKAIEFGELASDTHTVITNRMYLAILDGPDDPESSIEVIQEVLESPILEGDDNQLTFGYRELSRLQAEQRKYEVAYVSLDSSFHHYKNIYNDELSEQAAEANAKYETEKKDAELARQELKIARQDSQRNLILGSSLLAFVLLTAMYLWYYQKQRLKRKEADYALREKQKEAERMKELDEMKNQFFTNVSHELRTPLTLILGPLADVLEKTTDPSSQKSIHMAHNNAERLLDMVNEVLDLSKLETGHIEVSKDQVFLPSFVKRVLYAFESMAQIRDITLDVNEVPEVSVEVDADKLEKILNNLVSNAIKYSNNGGAVRLAVDRKNDQFSFAVKDTGKGIHPSEREKIFNRFYQSNLVTAVEGGGTGVGLALSRELAELLGGNLDVESELGEGSVFTLSLPMTEIAQGIEEEEVIKIESKSEAYSPILINGQRPHLLIVEDNIEMSEYLGDILNDGYRCTFVKDGYAALQKVQTESFDLISSDVMMPKMDGFQLKSKINEIKGMQYTPFIFLTARTLEEDKIEGLRLGVDDYITKPFNKYEYKARIHNLLKNKVERQQWTADGDSGGPVQANIEEQLLKSAEQCVLKNISNQDFKVSDLAHELNYSQRQLTRIVKNLTGMTPVNFVLELRLLRAHHLLKTKSFHTVNEVMYEVGIGSASYFGRKFKERFGISPGEVR